VRFNVAAWSRAAWPTRPGRFSPGTARCRPGSLTPLMPEPAKLATKPGRGTSATCLDSFLRPLGFIALGRIPLDLLNRSPAPP
jgi:hypothetical protein